MLDVKALILKILKQDYIVEEGISGIWTYRKWASGIAECWGQHTVTGSFASWGYVYSKDIGEEAYPSGLFIGGVVPFGRATVDGGNVISSIENTQTASITTHHPSIIVLRGTNFTGTKVFRIYRQAVGYWKTYTPMGG